MNLTDRLLEQSFVYRGWQATHADKKLMPLLAENDLRSVRRVLDVGCGPGTSTHLFPHADYLGVDINERYVDSARDRHDREFRVGDVTTCDLGSSQYDFILVNSLLHHLDDTGVRRLLSRLADVLSEGGHVHVLELVLPETRSLSRVMALLDRGRFARSPDEWRGLMIEHFDPVLLQPYTVRLARFPFLQMIYFKGKRRGK
ncbi:MAG: class I SAM-dependent methyltransferase [Gemmatimonadota bacterium]